MRSGAPVDECPDCGAAILCAAPVDAYACADNCGWMRTALQLRDEALPDRPDRMLWDYPRGPQNRAACRRHYGLPDDRVVDYWVGAPARRTAGGGVYNQYQDISTFRSSGLNALRRLQAEAETYRAPDPVIMTREQYEYLLRDGFHSAHATGYAMDYQSASSHIAVPNATQRNAQVHGSSRSETAIMTPPEAGGARRRRRRVRRTGR